jgi:hypothetical protein
MHDSIELEKRGIPTALICTEQFIRTAQTMAKICGLPDYPFAIIAHPLGNLEPDEVRIRAEGVASDVRRILVERGA